MSNKKVEKKETTINSTKVCAILYTITTSLWIFTCALKLYGVHAYGNKLDGFFWTDIGVTVVFGIIAVDYFIKWRKEKKAENKADVTFIEE